jgi:hypothetical protein
LFHQTGPRGQGRIRIPTSEIERLLEAMRVCPRQTKLVRDHRRSNDYPHIDVELGRLPGR